LFLIFSIFIQINLFMTTRFYFLYALILLSCIYYGQNLIPTPIQSVSVARDIVTLDNDLPIEQELIQLSWFAPSVQTGIASKWAKLEYGMKIPLTFQNQIETYLSNTKSDKGLNPYNPDQIDCYAEFKGPSGKVTRTNGFYYQPKIRDFVNKTWKSDTTSYPWRVRFAPDEVGEWEVTLGLVILKNGQKRFHNTTSTSFKCVASDHKGKLTYEKGDRYYKYSETDSSFFSVGGTIAHSDYYNLNPEASVQHIKWLDQLGNSDGNYFRLELSGRNGLPDWDNADNYDTRQEEMWELDKYIDKAEQHKMYFTIYRHHIEILDEHEWDVVRWENNPYRKMFNLANRSSYFQDQDVLRQQQKCLRYIFARWGYTPYFAFYGYTELDGWYDDMINQDGHSWAETETIFSGWLDFTIQYINKNTHYASGMYACGYASMINSSILKKSKVFPLCDMIPLHAYQSVKWGNYKEIYNYISDVEKMFPNIPIQLEEVGQLIESYCCTDVEFHNCLWSNSMMAISGTPNHWWWDRGIHYQEYYKQYEHINSFFENEELNVMNYAKQRWTDKPGPAKYQYRAKLENITMVSEDETRALGWVHNATYHWRNLEQTNDCIADLIDNGRFDSLVCTVESGIKIAVGNEQPEIKEKNVDLYTDRGGVVDIVNENPMEDNPTFEITGLKGNGNRTYNPWAKQHWYRVSYYNTRGAVSEKPVFIQVLATNSFGKLKPNVPNLDSDNPDYSYKVEYLGKFSKFVK
jgi:hypothetical protein